MKEILLEIKSKLLVQPAEHEPVNKQDHSKNKKTMVEDTNEDEIKGFANE